MLRSSPEIAKAAHCEAFFEDRIPRCHCNCFFENLTVHPPQYNCSTLIDTLMKEQAPQSSSTESSARRAAQSEEPRSGGVAILLRGHAFRGASHDDMAARMEAQLDCSRSVQRHIVEPFVRLGERVHAYLTVYDTVEEAMVHKLTHPYRAHLVGVTKLRAQASGQVMRVPAHAKYISPRGTKSSPRTSHLAPRTSHLAPRTRPHLTSPH